MLQFNEHVNKQCLGDHPQHLCKFCSVISAVSGQGRAQGVFPSFRKHPLSVTTYAHGAGLSAPRTHARTERFKILCTPLVGKYQEYWMFIVLLAEVISAMYSTTDVTYLLKKVHNHCS